MLRCNKVMRVAKVFSITFKCLLLAQKKKSNVDKIKLSWSREIVALFNMKINVLGTPLSKNDTGVLLIGNHVSYLDIPVLLNSTPAISFVSKSEVRYWPIIGNAAIKGRTIFVSRNSNQSRNEAKTKIASNLIDHKRNVIIFPSGTTSIKTSSFWKKGAFEIAEKNNIRLQPFRIRYHPLRAAAYVGKDNFLVHMFRLFRFKEIQVTIEYHPPVLITNSTDDCAFWKNWCEQ